MAAPDRVESRVAAGELVARVLDRLKPEQREVFMLKNQSGFTYAEIAEIIGCPIGTVRSRLHNAIQDLRAYAGELTT